MQKNAKRVIIIGAIVVWCFYFFWPCPEDRYEIRRDHKDRWLIDTEANFVIETDGRALEKKGNYIYSYGKSGFVIIDIQGNNIRFVFDENTSTTRMRRVIGRRRGYPQYVTLQSYEELNEEERRMYFKLKSKNDEEYSF